MTAGEGQALPAGWMRRYLDDAEVREGALKVLRKHPDGVTALRLCNALVGVDVLHSTAQRIIRRMIDNGDVTIGPDLELKAAAARCRSRRMSEEKTMSFCCPQCGTELGMEAKASIPDETKMQFTLAPLPGQLLQAKTVGGTLTALAGLMKAAGREAGCPTDVFIEGMSVVDGKLQFELRVVNVPA